MLFNEPAFLFLYAPAMVALFYGFPRWLPLEALKWTVILGSIFFYSWSSWWYCFIISGSILFNSLIARLLVATAERPVARYRLLVLGVVGNLAALGWFKYTNFLIDTVNATQLLRLPELGIVLPIGISFFTFQQIAYIVDVYQGKVPDVRLSDDAFFISFFPHQIAGPITHHSQLVPQFRRPDRAIALDCIGIGLTVFLIGLCKKALVADRLATYATPFFDLADMGRTFAPTVAWLGSLAYSLQLYFDFSGYSDMALGLGLMFGIVLPLNFASPYRATSIIEFWRRWHMTLSAFLRDYVYVPLGGNRKGPARRYLNVFITMLLGGIWHGAGWNFAIWGALHGLYILLNHAWRDLWASRRIPAIVAPLRPALAAAGLLLTFVLVVVAWVPFRAQTLTGAWSVWLSMAGLVRPSSSGAVREFIDPLMGQPLWEILGALALVLVAPNTQTLARWLYGLSLDDVRHLAEGRQRWTLPALPPRLRPLAWTVSAATGIAAACGLALNNTVSEFIYFRF
ncbi:MAG: MBOAT family O-acyltransferase [Geminicoccaceae bacterium]